MPVDFSQAFSVLQHDPYGRTFFQNNLWYLADGIILWPSELLSETKTNGVATLDAACTAHISDGFHSNTVSESHPHHYPYSTADQIDMLSAVAAAASVVIYCRSDAGVWAEVSHTAEQLAAVHTAGESFRRALLSACRTAKAAAMAAPTTLRVQAAVNAGLAAMEALIT
jgi:hypothetical protein